MRIRSGGLLLGIALSALPVIAGDAATLGDLAWMSGAWRSEKEGISMEEIWTDPAGGIMLGLHRDVTGGKASFEYMRIEQTPAGILYLASPGGRPPTPFRLTESQPGRVLFENPDHDFPKRIIYWLDDELRLCARVEAEAGGEGRQWCWSGSD